MAALRRDCASRRTAFRGVRCAGSVFRNPPCESAGRLIEQAGLKDWGVGAARVWGRHANVIVTESGATASDVGAVMEHVRGEVARQFGVDLKPEVALWD